MIYLFRINKGKKRTTIGWIRLLRVHPL